MGKHRDYKLKNELYFVVLRMVQLRDEYKKTGKGLGIYSVKYRGKELASNASLMDVDLSECDTNAADPKSVG